MVSSNRQTCRLQTIQNTAARIVKQIPRRNHITPVLCDLHWLPITSRINFKILVITFCGLRFKRPLYISELIHSYEPSRDLRSSSKDQLVQPRSNIKCYGSRSFAFAAATLWNQLPGSVRACDSLVHFKRSLKTHLFKLHYGWFVNMHNCDTVYCNLLSALSCDLLVLSRKSAI